MAAPHRPSDLSNDTALDAAKTAARSVARHARAGCDPSLGAVMSAILLSEAPPPPGAVVAGFWPMATEIDVRPVLHALHARGHLVLLPVTPERGLPLAFRAWTPGVALAVGRFGTQHCADPDPDSAPAPDWLLVPLLAFDRRLHRLGYGGGYYDRTLAALPHATAIGCAYAAQEIAAVPAGPHDRPLDAIATEHGIIRGPHSPPG